MGLQCVSKVGALPFTAHCMADGQDLIYIAMAYSPPSNPQHSLFRPLRHSFRRLSLTAILTLSPFFFVIRPPHLIYYIKTCIYTASWLWLALPWQVHAALTRTPQRAATEMGIIGSLGLPAVSQHLPTATIKLRRLRLREDKYPRPSPTTPPRAQPVSRRGRFPRLTRAL